MHHDFNVTAIRRVIDGDTFDFEVDLGFHTRMVKRFRLAGIDTAEIFGRNAEPAGTEQRDWVEQWLRDVAMRGELRIRTFKLNWNVPLADGGFGRWAGIVYNGLTMEFLSNALVAAGFTKLGEPLWIWDSVEKIQNEMVELHGMASRQAYELIESGDLTPREE